MDPDPEAGQYASKILKTAIITFVFSACQYDEKEKTVSSFSPLSLPRTPIANNRYVIVKKRKKIIYLTFDDGPNKGTRKVFHIANEEKVPITMFIVGEHVYGSEFQKETWDSLLTSDLIEICNHSYTHASNHYQEFYSNADSVVNDFKRCNDSLCFRNNIIRTPGRNIWRTENVSSTDIRKSAVAADSLDKENYTIIGWDLEWHYDGKSLKLENSADSLLKQIDSTFAKGKTKNEGHLVLLAHDQVYADDNDSSELHLFIDKLKKKEEYSLEFISKYPGIRN